MKTFEEAAINDCATRCAFEIYKTMRLFKGFDRVDRALIKKDIESMIERYVEELEKCQLK